MVLFRGDDSVPPIPLKNTIERHSCAFLVSQLEAYYSALTRRVRNYAGKRFMTCGLPRVTFAGEPSKTAALGKRPHTFGRCR